jgi:flagellar biosynthesis GTPase FlhF
MITEGLQNIAEGFKKKFSRETVAATVGNPRNATRQMAQRKPAPVKAMGVKKPTVGKVGSVDTAFFTKTAEKKNPKLQMNDSVADVAGKLFSLIKSTERERKIHFELNRDFEKENIDEDAKRHKELVEALEKQREKKEKEPKPEEKKKEEEKKPEEKKKEEKKPEEKKKEEKKPEEKKKEEKKAPEKTEAKAKEEVKKTTEKAPEPQAKPPEPKTKPAEPQAKPPEPKVKPAEPQAKPPEPKVKPAEPQAKPPVTAKPVEPAPAAPQAPTPTVTVPKPSIPSGASTAVKIATGAIAVAGALAGKEALAENISKYESKGAGGYNAYNKGTIGNKMIGADKPIDFSKITISEFLKRGALKPGDPDRLFAVGRYQIIPTTMESLVKKLKLDPDKTYLDSETQDSLFSNGLVGVIRKKVDNYIKGLSDDKNAAILELAKEFASVGIPYDMNVGKKELKKGDSYYSGQGGNKAHNSPEEVGAALDADRMKKLGTTKPALSENVSKYETGQKIASSSTENQDLKKQGAPGTTVIMNNSQTNVSQSTPSKQKTLAQGSSPDLPAHQQG